MAQMSENYQKTEEKKAQEERAAAQKKIDDGTVVFWSKQTECRLANFVPETRDGSGRIIQPESPLPFHGNVFITNDPKKIEFIRSHDAFEQGDVCEVASIAEAEMKTRALEAEKYGTREVKIESVESTEIKD